MQTKIIFIFTKFTNSSCKLSELIKLLLPKIGLIESEIVKRFLKMVSIMKIQLQTSLSTLIPRFLDTLYIKPMQCSGLQQWIKTRF